MQQLHNWNAIKINHQLYKLKVYQCFPWIHSTCCPQATFLWFSNTFNKFIVSSAGSEVTKPVMPARLFVSIPTRDTPESDIQSSPTWYNRNKVSYELIWANKKLWAGQLKWIVTSRHLPGIHMQSSLWFLQPNHMHIRWQFAVLFFP